MSFRWNSILRVAIFGTLNGIKVCSVLVDLESRSFTDDLDQYPLGSSAVELSVEDLFPGPEIELSPG